MDYASLLAEARADPENADFHALRMAYTRTAAYSPYRHHHDAVVALRDALQAGALDRARAAVADLLAFNYLDIEAHMAADYIATQLDDRAGAAYHRAWARGLIDAILATGTGRDFTTAWIVLSTAEEYTILRVLGLAPGGQQLVEHDGHWFDVLTAQQRSSGQSVELVFNIDLPYRWLQAHNEDPFGGDADAGDDLSEYDDASER